MYAISADQERCRVTLAILRLKDHFVCRLGNDTSELGIVNDVDATLEDHGLEFFNQKSSDDANGCIAIELFGAKMINICDLASCVLVLKRLKMIGICLDSIVDAKSI